MKNRRFYNLILTPIQFRKDWESSIEPFQSHHLSKDEILHQINGAKLQNYTGIFFPYNSLLHEDFCFAILETLNAGLQVVLQTVTQKAESIFQIKNKISPSIKLSLLIQDPLDFKKILEPYQHFEVSLHSKTVKKNLFLLKQNKIENFSFYCILNPQKIKNLKNNKLTEILNYSKFLSLNAVPSLTDLYDCNNTIYSTTLNDSLKMKSHNASPTKPRVSIVIPFRDGIHNLKKVLLNIYEIEALSEEFEVVLVDDGSSNDSLQTIINFCSEYYHDVNYQIHSLPNRSAHRNSFRAGIARNIGGFNAKGDILLFLDGDILLHPKTISELILKHKYWDLIQFPRYNLKEESLENIITYENVKNNDISMYQEDYWKKFFEQTVKWDSIDYKWKYVCTYALSIKTETFKVISGFRNSFYSYGFEDTDLGLRLNELSFHLSPIFFWHLEDEKSKFLNKDYFIERNSKLRETAHIFYFNNVDLNIQKTLFSLVDNSFLTDFMNSMKKNSIFRRQDVR